MHIALLITVGRYGRLQGIPTSYVTRPAWLARHRSTVNRTLYYRAGPRSFFPKKRGLTPPASQQQKYALQQRRLLDYLTYVHTYCFSSAVGSQGPPQASPLRWETPSPLRPGAGWLAGWLGPWIWRCSTCFNQQTRNADREKIK